MKLTMQGLLYHISRMNEFDSSYCDIELCPWPHFGIGIRSVWLHFSTLWRVAVVYLFLAPLEHWDELPLAVAQHWGIFLSATSGFISALSNLLLFKDICLQCMQTALADEHREIDIKHINTLSFSKHICVKGIWGSQIIPDLESLDGPPDGGEFVPVGSI